MIVFSLFLSLCWSLDLLFREGAPGGPKPQPTLLGLYLFIYLVLGTLS